MVSITDVIGEKVVSRSELCVLLGKQNQPISERTVARYENEPNGLPYIIIGGRKHYRLAAVRDWILRRERRPNPRRKAD